MKNASTCLATAGIFLLLGATAPSAPVAYTDEATFLAELASLGHPVLHEGFEDDAAWGDVRSTISGGTQSAPGIVSQSLMWTANNLSSEITTSNGAAMDGAWGVYSIPHGSYLAPDPGMDPAVPGECGDGLRCSTVAGSLVGFGGWVRTNTPPAELGVYVGQYPDNQVDLGETCDPTGEDCVDNGAIGTQAKFVGVIDPAGFGAIEIRELEGTIGELKFVFMDDFYFAGPGLASAVDSWLLLE